MMIRLDAAWIVFVIPRPNDAWPHFKITTPQREENCQQHASIASARESNISSQSSSATFSESGPLLTNLPFSTKMAMT